MVRQSAGLPLATRIALAVALAVIARAGVDGQSAAQSGMSIAATVNRSCQIDGASLAFGTYDPVSRNATAPLDGETILVVTCTRGTPAAIALNAGGHASGGRRFMASGANLLNYDLYQDAGRGQHWGDSPGDVLMLGPSTGDPKSVYIYGRVSADQDVPVGAYADTVVATVYF
ncbi:MAG TPA: spore coat U domain-containing protein [Vicinamibacterales bacterium]|nr:spore coat U domain-containing protein [Vicinamibacterales bacterium]